MEVNKQPVTLLAILSVGHRNRYESVIQPFDQAHGQSVRQRDEWAEKLIQSVR